METNNLQNNHEIDLLDLLKRVWKAASSAIGIAIIFLIKKSLWLIGFFIIGVMVSFFFYSSLRRSYSSVMMAQANVLDNAFMISYIKEIGKIDDIAVRAKTLHLPDSTARHISSLDAFYGIDTDADGSTDYIDLDNSFKYDPKDIACRVAKIFYVQATVSDEAVFTNLTQGLTEALSTNPYIIDRNTLRLHQLRNQLQEVNMQLNLLDSVQRSDYFNDSKRSKENQVLLTANEVGRKLYHPDVLNLYKEKQAVEEELAGYNQQPITVIRDFSALSVANDPIGKYLKQWVPFCLIIGLIFLIIRDNRKKLWRLITQ